MKDNKVKVGLMGLGTVGTGVVRLLDNRREDLRKQTGLEIEIARVLVRDPSKPRQVTVDPSLITGRVEEVIEDPEIDVVVEVIGGIEPTRDYVMSALLNGKHVVTANKDLMAIHGAELLGEAAAHGCDLFYEASVAGGIPILRALVEGFSSDRITKMMGIVNGTTNYILTKMSQEGLPYEDILEEAKRKGYAESDPSSDLEGLDAARKMAIMGTLGFHTHVVLEDVSVRGITHITLEDIRYAQQMGYEMKLLGIAKQDHGLIEVSVEPTLIPKEHPLATVSGVYNAVYVYGEAVGETMFYGPGAGEMPTATAVVSDLVTVVKNLKLGVNGRGMVAPYRDKRLKTDEQIMFKNFLRLIAEDKAGVLAQVTQILSENDVSLERVLQTPYQDALAEVVLITHRAPKKALDLVVEALKKLSVIGEVRSRFRVEEGE